MNPGRVVSALVATKLRIVLVGVLALFVILGGAFAVGILGVPGVAAIDNTFGDVTDETTTIETDLVISNPNPIGIGLDDITVNYTISMNSIEMAYGEREGVAVGTSNSTLDLETQMQNDAIPSWWVSHIQNDERTVIDIDATVTSDRLGRSADLGQDHDIETNLIGAFNSEETRPVNADSPLTDDPVLYINETRGEWGTVSEADTPIDMEFVVYNPNVEPYAITELGYEITMNDVEVGEGETHEEHVILPDSSETIALTTTIDNQQLDDWWVTHLDEEVHGHQVSELRIEFYAVVELPTGEEVTVPLDELTYEETLGTDIFDEGGDVGEPVDPNDEQDDGDEQDESTDDSDEQDDTGEDDSADGEPNGDDTDEGDTGEDDEQEEDDEDEDDQDEDDPDDDQDEDDDGLPL